MLNPQNFVSDATEVEQNCDATLPLGVGYYAFDQATTIPRFLSFWDLSVTARAEVPRITRIPAGAWTCRDGAAVSTHGDALRMALPADGRTYVGRASTHVVVPTGADFIRIAIREIEGQWGAEWVGDDTAVRLLPGAAMAGLYYLDLRDAIRTAGSSGQLILDVVGYQSAVTIDEIAFVPALSAEQNGSLEYRTTWSPGGLGFWARYRNGEARGADTFVDRDSVLREISFDTPLGEGMHVVGRHVAPPVYDAEANTVSVVADAMTCVVAIPDGAGIRFYSDESEMVDGVEGRSEPVGPVGVWAVALQPGNTIYRVGIGMSPNDVQHASALALAAASRSARECCDRGLEAWDKLLSRVPRPASFDVFGVDAGASRPVDIRNAYYHAYIGLISNVLPPQPEVDYAYPTVATGKASMWNHGTTGARSAAAWETFLGIQYLAYVEPDLGWACFNGLMSRVDEQGSLGGESLPSRKAQTAAVLFGLTQDRQQLEHGYRALIRLLRWEAERPRWIYGTYDNDGEEDAEFVSSLLIDIDLAIGLASAIARHEDVVELERMRADLARRYREHFFVGPNRRAVQHWFADDESASMRGGPDGFGLQVTSGLAVSGLDDWQVSSLLARFDAQYQPSDQLAGFDVVKHPNVSHTVTGLIDHGHGEQAKVLANAILRDVVASGSFAEVYDRGSQQPRPWGVRPSIFGMTQVIDSVWLNNGLRTDRGLPQPVGLPGADGAVTNIRVNGRVDSVAVRGGDASWVPGS